MRGIFRPLRSNKGQGTTEMVFLIPLFVTLAAGAIFIVYMCWQGIKVQEAANFAARVAGQESVGGARDYATLLSDNGVLTAVGSTAAGDADPSTCQQADTTKMQACLDSMLATNGGSGAGAGNLGTKTPASGGGTGVYWSFRKAVYNMFSAGEQKNLFVPAPATRGGITEVKVNRVMRAPTIFNWHPPIVSIEGKAYGGEDTYMYALRRFGHTGGITTNNTDLPFWQQILQKMQPDKTNQ